MGTEKIKSLVDTINTLKEELLSVPDDILLSIDSSDNESVRRGSELIQEYNDCLLGFNERATTLVGLVQKAYEMEDAESEDVEQESAESGQNDRIIKELDKTEPHFLNEDFKWKRPYGFVLKKKAYKGVKTWRSLYQFVLTELNKMDEQKFNQLTTNESFVSKKGNCFFADTEDALRESMTIPNKPNFYAEVNLSANNLRDRISDLLGFFSVDQKEMKIYLREDRDAERL